MVALFLRGPNLPFLILGLDSLHVHLFTSCSGLASIALLQSKEMQKLWQRRKLVITLLHLIVSYSQRYKQLVVILFVKCFHVFSANHVASAQVLRKSEKSRKAIPSLGEILGQLSSPVRNASGTTAGWPNQWQSCCLHTLCYGFRNTLVMCFNS